MCYAVRGEMGATGKELFAMFRDCIEGKDMEYGYDVKNKLKLEFQNEQLIADENMDNQMDVDTFGDDEKVEYKESMYVSLCKKLKSNGITYGMDFDKTMKQTASICSDGANNFYGNGIGFEGHRLRYETELHESEESRVRTIRNWCVNHVMNLPDNETDEDYLTEITELLNSFRMFWNKIGHKKVCPS